MLTIEELREVEAAFDAASPGPWRLRELPTHPNLGCFIEAPKAKGMPYSLEVFGEDYTGYGDDKQRRADLMFALLMHKHGAKILALAHVAVLD